MKLFSDIGRLPPGSVLLSEKRKSLGTTEVRTGLLNCGQCRGGFPKNPTRFTLLRPSNPPLTFPQPPGIRVGFSLKICYFEVYRSAWELDRENWKSRNRSLMKVLPNGVEKDGGATSGKDRTLRTRDFTTRGFRGKETRLNSRERDGRLNRCFLHFYVCLYVRVKSRPPIVHFISQLRSCACS